MRDKKTKMADIPNPDPLWVIYDLWRESWDKKRKREVKG